jgi:hypothetical protein
MNSAAAAATIPTTVPICLILVFILISDFQHLEKGVPATTTTTTEGHLSRQ